MAIHKPFNPEDAQRWLEGFRQWLEKTPGSRRWFRDYLISLGIDKEAAEKAAGGAD